MSRIITLIFTICIFNFKSFAFEPYSGISCHNSNVRGKVEFFFKHDENFIYATAYKRVNGEFKLRRDFQINKGDKVLIVEDVITTGKSSIECSKIVTANKGNIIGYACIIDRSNGKSRIKEKIISQVELNIPTYEKDNLPKELSSIKAVKPGSRNL